jgi:hypothetical protein
MEVETRGRNTFVAPYRDPSPAQQIVEVEVARELPIAPQTVLMPKAGYEDRSRGFVVATMPLAATVGFMATISDKR